MSDDTKITFKKKRIQKSSFRSISINDQGIEKTNELEKEPMDNNLSKDVDSEQQYQLQEDDRDNDEPINVDDVLLIRKLKKKTRGLDVIDLIKGKDSSKKKRKSKEKGDSEDEDEDGPYDPFAKIKSGGFYQRHEMAGSTSSASGHSTSFAAASTAMDAEKHMREYVERQLKKSQQSSSDQVDEDGRQMNSSHANHDIKEKLFEIPKHLEVAAKPVKEDNVAISASMLTAVPEVDLGVENKLRNIERTEDAKRRLMESNVSVVPIDSTRFRAVGGQRTFESKPFATDSLAMDKFKKRLKRI